MSDYRINGVDPETLYKLIIERGIDAQIRPAAELKENGLSIDWIGENGTERYHGIKTFKSKTYTIPCVLICSTNSEFNTKYEALKLFLHTTTSEFNLDIVSRNRRYKVSYLNMTGYQKYGPAARFNLILIDDHPTEIFTIP